MGDEVRCRGVRGAVTVATDDADAIVAATKELLETLAELNGFVPDELGSILFTTTSDISATFPARAARKLGWTSVPMMCARELDSPTGLPRCIRVLAHWNTTRSSDEIRHIYLGEARQLRPDWAWPPFGAEAPAPQPVGIVAPAAVGGEERSAALGQPWPVAFQGEPGAYSNLAIVRWLGPEAEVLPCPTFASAFEAVHEGRARCGLLPVENSTTGSIHPVYDLLIQHGLTIQGEVILRIRHALLGVPGATLADIEEVRSHPQALEQCQRWIAGHGWRPEARQDTAGSARMVAELGDKRVAAVASTLAAERYGLEVLAADIQDVARNYTRFLVLAERPLDGLPEPEKTSIIFATRHVAGDLYSCLAEFAVREVNLTKIESRPDRTTPWSYRFYLDFEGHPGQEIVRQSLAGLGRHTSFLRVLGSYASTTLE